MSEPHDPYSRIIRAFDRSDIAQQFLSEDGEGGFAAGVVRMAEEIDRLRKALAQIAEWAEHGFSAPGPRNECERYGVAGFIKGVLARRGGTDTVPCPALCQPTQGDRRMSDDDDAWMDELVPPGAKLKRQDAELDRLRTEVVCLRCEIDWRGEEIKRLRQKLMDQSADPGSDGGQHT